ncbi:MAG: hypothetical protein QM778_10165 [Myxococcales bacterium]
MGYELLETMVEAVRNNKEEIAGLLHDTSGLLKGLNNVIGKNEQKFHNIIANVETASDEGTQLIKGVRTNYVDSPQIKRIVNNIDKTMAETSPLVKEVRTTVSDVLGPEQREKLKSTISDASILADRAKVTLSDAQAIMTHMKRGEGTVGGLLMDEEIYDDVQEMLRDLKHNPWKLFWRE